MGKKNIIGYIRPIIYNKVVHILKHITAYIGERGGMTQRADRIGATVATRGCIIYTYCTFPYGSNVITCVTDNFNFKCKWHE